MKGLELSEKYYYAHAKQIIERDFSDVYSRLAIGLVGQGSECFGFDDEISCDHDFEPGFCIWISDEDYEKFGFRLERMYAKLPKEFEGYKRSAASPVGGARHGVMKISSFYESFLGTPIAPVSTEQWLYIPPHALATACNGRVFYDEAGDFSKIRNTLLQGYPEDIRLKKIAAHTIMMAQTGLYNYQRCVKRAENGAAQLCVFEFVKHAISLIYLLNNKYEPFYKWAYKGMRAHSVLSNLEASLVGLTELGNSKEEARAKTESMEEICKEFIREFEKQKLITASISDFEACAYSIRDKIKNPTLRNMHIMDGI